MDAANKAGRVAAQLYRNGGDDTSLELFFAGSAASADDLLARLGTMDQLIERNQAVYGDAITARDAAQSLSDQAVVARDERDRLQKVAEQKMVEAQQAADAAQAALDAQQAHLTDLQAQLAALQDTTAKHDRGLPGRRRGRAQRPRGGGRPPPGRRPSASPRPRRRLPSTPAAAAAVVAAVVAATAAPWSAQGGVVPSSGYQSSGYGARTVQCGANYCSSGFHYGVDLAAACGSAIYAANGGTVVYAGPNGGYGNYIKIDHGGGIGTGYGHIMRGGILVGYGQRVASGQLIAYEGNTGNSFGCHLHFETYVNGYPVNPIYFMADRGISV